MTIFFHELRRNKLSLIIWSGVLSFMLAVCVLIYPLMELVLEEAMNVMGGALGVEDLGLGSFTEYFGAECASNLGLGGGIFASILAISVLCKEEKDKTAEFLLTLPITRSRIITEKLVFVIAEILILNLCVALFSVLSILAIGVEADAGAIALMFLSLLILQLEVAFICFGLSAFLKGGGIGIGLGVSLGFYFLNFIASLTKKLEFLNYLTPFAYVNSYYIIENGALDIKYIIVGTILGVGGIVLAYVKYTRKDIA